MCVIVKQDCTANGKFGDSFMGGGPFSSCALVLLLYSFDIFAYHIGGFDINEDVKTVLRKCNTPNKVLIFTRDYEPVNEEQCLASVRQIENIFNNSSVQFYMLNKCYNGNMLVQINSQGEIGNLNFFEKKYSKEI